ncbi:unnamed protein product [Coffea canephora]|uniref:DH200=94 genomic scaffold, scaffold_67 n=1 Tax=Coffea canephora TaxID=49390 RepID=A0A068UW24_COFCA|nr:unnamed protein product [Coffea canephora]
MTHFWFLYIPSAFSLRYRYSFVSYKSQKICCLNVRGRVVSYGKNNLPNCNFLVQFPYFTIISSSYWFFPLFVLQYTICQSTVSLLVFVFPLLSMRNSRMKVLPILSEWFLFPPGN